MNYQCKSIGNPVEISMKYQWKSIGNPVEIQLDIGNSIRNSIGDFNEIPIHWKSS